MEKRSVLQKVVLISVAAMAVLFGILTLISHVRKGVEFEGGLLRRTETEESVIYNGKVQGERVKITVTDCPDEQRTAEIAKLEQEMKEASKLLEFEYAAVLRDRIIELRGGK